MPVRPARRRFAASASAVLLGAGIVVAGASPAQALAVSDAATLNAAILANEPLLEITGDFTLGGNVELIDYDVEIVGNGHTINADGFEGFLIVGSASVTGLTIDNARNHAISLELLAGDTGSIVDFSTHNTGDSALAATTRDGSALQVTGGTHEDAQEAITAVAEGDSSVRVSGLTATDIGRGIYFQGSGDATLAFSDVTLTAGPLNNSGYVGSGMFIDLEDASTATIDATTITSSPDPALGAFRYSMWTYEYGSTSIAISNSRLVGAEGGIRSDVYQPTGSLTLTGTSVTGAAGDGVFLNLAGSVVIDNSLIDGNGFSDNGEGIDLQEVFDGGQVTVRTSTVSNNFAGGIGGELYDGGALNVVDSTIGDNANVGIEVDLFGDARMTVTGSTVSGNTAGGVWAWLYDQSAAAIDSSTISGTLTGVGEAWALWGGSSPDARLDVSHTTVTDNAGVVALGFEDVTATVTHSIIAGNDIAGPYGEVWIDDDATVDVTVDWSVLGAINDETGGTGYMQGAGVTTGVTDPGLEPLAMNGGPTRTHLFTMASPAYNAGNPAIVGAPANDQRGLARIVGAAIDIGAVEIVPTMPATGSEPAPAAITGALFLLIGGLIVLASARRGVHRTILRGR